MKIFVGSSSKHLDAARKVAEIIEENMHQPQLWRNCFVAPDNTFEKLIQVCGSVDAAIFILAPDDQLLSEEDHQSITRDNVLFEAGLFLGKLGNPYVSLCRFPETKIPSDFHGITLINYENNREFNLQRQIVDWINVIEENENIKNNTVVLKPLSECSDFNDIIANAKQEILMSSFFMSIAQISRELNEAINRGIEVRFLLPDWRGDNWMATVALLDGVNADERRARRKLMGTLLWIKEMNQKGRVPNNFKIRLLDCVFPTRMTIVDSNLENAYMSIHVSSYTNRFSDVATYCLPKQHYWFEIYKKEFDNMWEDARDLDFNEIEEL